MCNAAVIEFFIDNVKLEEFVGKRILEVSMSMLLLDR